MQLGANASKDQKNLPSLSIVLNKADGSSTTAEIYAFQTRFDGEEAIEIQLVTSEDKKLLKRIQNFPWKLCFSFICLAAILLLPNVLFPRLNVNNAPATYLPSDAPSVVLNDAVREIFPNDQVFVLLFEGIALYSDGFMEAYEALTIELEEHEQIDDIVSLTRQDHISGTDDGFIVEPLIDIETLDDSHPRDRIAHILNDRFARNSLISNDGSAVGMVIIPKPLNNSILNLSLEEDILDAVRVHRLDGYLSAMAGEVRTDVAQMRIILRDNMIFIPITVGIGLLLTWILFQRVIAVIATGVVTGAVVNSTIAFYVLFQQPFNSISGIIPPLLSALTIAALVHFYNALHYASKRGLSGKERVQAALLAIKRPAFFSALTTSVGLASLGLSPIPPIQVFGLTAAVGVFIIYLIVIYLLPPIFAQFDHHEWPSRKSGLWIMDKLVSYLFHTGMRHPRIIIAAFAISLAAFAPYIAKVGVETNLLEFFPTDHTLRQDIDHIEEKLVGTTPLEIVLTSEDEAGIIQPEVLNAIKQLQLWLTQRSDVDKTLSIADFIEEMHWGFHAEDNAYRSIPEDPELISQYLFIYDGDGIYDFIDENFQTARVALNVNVHGANEISKLIEDTSVYLTKHPIQNVQWNLSGYGRMFAEQEDLLVEGQVKSLVGAIVLIFLLMLVLWRSLKDSLICMVPNLSPILLIFITMGATSIHLDFATAMIASVAVGIAIDDTIHVYHGFIHRVNQGIRPVTAMVRAYRHAGRAVVTTTVILCGQFLLLLNSSFVPMGYFGVLVSIGLLTALLFDLLLLPAFLVVFFNKQTTLPAKGLKAKDLTH